MKKRVTVFFLSALTIFLAHGLLHETAAQEEPMQPEPAQEVTAESAPVFTIARMVVCSGVEALEPVDIAQTFPSTTEKVYSFLEARDIPEDTTVTFVWYLDENVVAKVDLPLTKGQRWRTYSSKNIAGFKGNWKVELQDADGTTLNTVEFTVE